MENLTLNNKVLNNATWIIVCKIVQAVLGVVITMLSARYLGPSNYGLISYAASIVAFFTPIMQLGLNATLVKEFIEKPECEGEILGTAILMNVISAVVCIAGIYAFIWIANPNEPITLAVCVLYSLNLIFQALEMSQYWFQSKLLSKYTSLTMLFAYIIASAYKIFLLVTQKSIYWFAIAQAIDYMIIAGILLVIYRRLGGQKLSFSFIRSQELLQQSKHYILAAMMVMVFQQTDKIMLKNMIGDAATGYYSVAVDCACMTGFVFTAIISSMRPVILESKKGSVHTYEQNVSRLFSIIFYGSLAQCVCMTLLAWPIIHILYGAEYEASVNVLRLVVWYTTYSYFGGVRNVWILAEEKQRYLWIINLLGALANVALNFMLIPGWGIMGAAFASFVTQFFTNFILGFIMQPIRDCNHLMLKGMNPKFACKEMKVLVSSMRK